MPVARRVRFNILAKDVLESTRFYQRVAGMVEVQGHSWITVLTLPHDSQFEIGLIDEVSQYVPHGARGIAEGAYLTLVVDDVVATVDAAFAEGVEIVEPPRGEGRRMRALIRDPNGVIIDVVTPDVAHHMQPESVDPLEPTDTY